MKRLYILIVLVLWGFAQFAEAQNMYRNYYSSIYDVTGRELQCGSTQNQVRNVLNISGSVFILKAKDSAGNQVVKKIVRL